jgi:hypothetical protein
MTFALNQALVNVTSGGGSTNVPYGSSVGLGDLLVLCIIGTWTASGALNITDSQGNVWFTAISSNSGTHGVGIAWAIAKTSGACTITTNPAGSTSLDLVAYDFSGFNGKVLVDQTAAPGTGANPNDSVGPVTTQYANEVGIAGFYCNGSSTGGNWNAHVTTNTNLAEYILLTSSGSQTATCVGGATGDICALVTFYSPTTPYYVQHAISEYGTGTSPMTVTLTGTTAGNTLCVMATTQDSASGVPATVFNTPSDGVNTYLPCTGTTYSGTYLVYRSDGVAYYATNIHGGTVSLSMTITPSSGTADQGLYIFELSNAPNYASGVGAYGTNSTAIAGTPNIVQTHVQTGVTSGNEIQLDYQGAQTAGNTNIILIAWDDATTTLSGTPFDTKTNGYSLIGSVASNGVSMRAYIATSIATAAAGANTVTVQWSGSPSFPEVYLFEVSPSLLDVGTVSFVTNAGSSLGSAGPVTTGHPSELMIGYCFNDNTATGPGTGWTNDSNSVTGYGSVAEYQAATPSGSSVTATTPISGTPKWAQCVFGLYPLPVPFTTAEQVIIVSQCLSFNQPGTVGPGYTLIENTVGFGNCLEQGLFAAGPQQAQIKAVGDGAHIWGIIAAAFGTTPPSPPSVQISPINPMFFGMP